MGANPRMFSPLVSLYSARCTSHAIQFLQQLVLGPFAGSCRHEEEREKEEARGGREKGIKNTYQRDPDHDNESQGCTAEARAGKERQERDTTLCRKQKSWQDEQHFSPVSLPSSSLSRGKTSHPSRAISPRAVVVVVFKGDQPLPSTRPFEHVSTASAVPALG